MDTSTFNGFRELIYAHSGITLGPNKEALVSSRIGKRMRVLRLEDPREYLHRVKEDAAGNEIVYLLDAISTNVTSFFRESRHFDLLRELAEKWYAAGQRRFRIWCAASSSGEEPFSIAITLREAMPCDEMDVRILATDISTQVLETGRHAVYPQDRIESVPETLRNKYFQSLKTQTGCTWRVNAEVRALVEFRRLNLMDRFDFKSTFPLIFCRNVMIYFDRLTQADLVRRLGGILQPGGYLFVGHSESLAGIDHCLEYLEPAIYRKPERRGQ